MLGKQNYKCIEGKYYKITHTEAVKKQEKWRRKQIEILYCSGRPIFGKYIEKFR